MIRLRRPPRRLGALVLAAGLLVACGSDDGPDGAPHAVAEIDRYAYVVSFISLPVTEERSPHLARKLAWQAHDALVDGQDFAAVARSRSKDESTRGDGGFFGFVPTGHDTAFAGALQVLRPGAISPPLYAGRSWRVLKRHTFEEGRRLEQRYRIPVHGFVVPWEAPGRDAEGRTKEQAKALASEMVERLAGGRITLEQAAQRFTPRAGSVAPEAFIGDFADREGMREVFRALKDAEPGRLVGPIETPGGFGVLVRGRYLRSLFRHILIQHVGSRERSTGITRTPDQARVLAEQVLAEARADPGAWDALVTRYTDDPSTRASGGTMGVLSPGALPPGFEKVVYDMEPGEIHEAVVETPFGFHVLLRVN